ncbi:hypothetical protein D3C75_762060 [compost metagenome]
MENRHSTIKSVVRDGTIPRSPRYAVTIAAGMPDSRRLPSSPIPGAKIPALIGSSKHHSSSSCSKPCHLSPGFSVQQAGSVVSCSRDALTNGTSFPAVSVMVGAFHGEKNQSLFLANAACTFASARRKSTASTITSCVNASPWPPSIIAAPISLEAMIAYSGEVVACSMYDSLKRECSTGFLPLRMWM